MHGATDGTLALGTMVGLEPGVRAGFAAVRELGLATCQLSCWKPAQRTPALAATVRAAARELGVEISSFWAGHSGEAAWNFTRGPATIGLVPPATRAQRLGEYLQAVEFAAAIGAPSITTHIGFIPEDPADPQYAALVVAIRTITQACAAQGLEFWLETGQETPVTLMRTIGDVGRAGLGINLDPANLVLYGKANPVDALLVLGSRVRGLHAKDGRYPTDPWALGEETAIGQGVVDFPRLIAGLRAHGFSGRVTIEREISGPEQRADIIHAIALLRPLLAGGRRASSG
jgi:L-ribulose-5-phosphate 3-epimerase